MKEEILELIENIGVSVVDIANYPENEEHLDYTQMQLVTLKQLVKKLTIPVVRFSKPTYKDKNKLPDDIKYIFHKGVDLYQTIMDYERGIIGPEEFIVEMRKVDKAY